MDKERITIIGSGNFAMAIGKRLIEYGGFEVIFGSREPNSAYIAECLNSKEFTVTSVEKAFAKSTRIIILAVLAKKEIYESLSRKLVENIESTFGNNKKIIVEISNILDDEPHSKVSNAECLETILNSYMKNVNLKVSIVKAFNLVNSYSIGSNIDNEKPKIETIPLAGDDHESKEYIIKFCNRIGFQAFDVGLLRNAFKLETLNKKTFTDWYYPSILSILFTIFNFIWIFVNYFIFPKNSITFEKYLEEFSLLSHLNKVLGYTSLQLLAFVYLGGVVASIYQLKNGTKYKRFPAYLNYWLLYRKQFGLWAFLLASFHGLASMLVVNPAYLDVW
jgi:predicted dinucleotide-binding enzyme